MAVFAVLVTFGDGALRDLVRPTHRVYLKERFDAGDLVESGPYVDDSGALMVDEADSEEAVRAFLAADPY